MSWAHPGALGGVVADVPGRTLELTFEAVWLALADLEVAEIACADHILEARAPGDALVGIAATVEAVRTGTGQQSWAHSPFTQA